MGCAFHQLLVPVFNFYRACIANRNKYTYFSIITKHKLRSMKMVVDELQHKLYRYPKCKSRSPNPCSMAITVTELFHAVVPILLHTSLRNSNFSFLSISYWGYQVYMYVAKLWFMSSYQDLKAKWNFCNRGKKNSSEFWFVGFEKVGFFPHRSPQLSIWGHSNVLGYSCYLKHNILPIPN